MLNEAPDEVASGGGGTGAARAAGAVEDATVPAAAGRGAADLVGGEGYVTVTQQDREAISRVSEILLLLFF